LRDIGVKGVKLFLRFFESGIGKRAKKYLVFFFLSNNDQEFEELFERRKKKKLQKIFCEPTS